MKKLGHVLLFIILLGSCDADLDIAEAVILPPSEVRLLFPENNSECTTGTVISESESEVTFNWTQADVTEGYLVYLTDLTTNEETVVEADSTAMPITIKRGTPYRWSVITYVDDFQNPTTSPDGFFYNAGPGIVSYIPFPASAISPETDAQLIENTTSINLQWTAEDVDDDITGFDLYFGTTDQPELLAENLETPSYANVSVSSGNTYYWKVITKDANGNVANSVLFQFEVLE